MPVHYFNQLGDNFVVYLLENIENPPSREHEREIVDIFIGLVLSYNLQFKDKSSNVAVKCLRSMSSAKAFTEQVWTPGLKQPISIKSDTVDWMMNDRGQWVLWVLMREATWPLSNFWFLILSSLGGTGRLEFGLSSGEVASCNGMFLLE